MHPSTTFDNSSVRHRLPNIVLAVSGKITLSEGQTKTFRLSIPAIVQTELRRAARKGVHTLNGHLVVELGTSSGASTRRIIPVKLKLVAPTKKHG